MEDLVENVLQAAAEKESKFKTIEVQKDIELELDEGNLLAVDQNPIELRIFKSNKEDFLLNLARENTQILVNRIWELPVERREDAVVAGLPDPKTILPREKPIPKEKKQTKWEAYAQMKGINNKKKGRMVYDEKAKDYKPRWGYKRANDETKEWVLEVPQNADPFEDQFEKRTKAKKERVAKNELQRLRNIARSSKGKVPGVGLTPTDKPDKDHLAKALTMAKKSTASVGKFTEKLPKEKRDKNSGKKRKFEPNEGNSVAEKKRALDILGRLHNKQPVLDVTRATNQSLADEDRKRAMSNKKGGKKGGKGKQSTPMGKGKKQGPPMGGKGKKQGPPMGKKGGGKMKGKKR